MSDAADQAAALLHDGDFNAALDVLDSALAADPDDRDARRLRAETLTARSTPQSLKAALADFDALPDLTADDALLITLAHERLDDPEAALDHLERAVERWPGHARLRLRLMEAAFKAGDLPKAQRAVRGLSDDWRMLEYAADLTAAFADAPGADDLLAEADDLYTMALVSLPEADWTRPFRARIVLARAGVNLRRYLPDEVARDAATAAALIPSEPAAGFFLGWSLVKRGSVTDGLAKVRAALSAASEPVRDLLWRTIAHDVDFQDLMNAL